MVAASKDSESDGQAGFGLCSFSPSTDAFSRDDEDDGDEGVLCWWSCRPCLCVFLAFDSVVLMAFSALTLSRFFLFFLFSFFFVLSLFLMVFTVTKGKKETPYVLCVLYLLPLFSFHFFLLLPLSRSNKGFLVSKKSLLSFSLFCLRLLFSSLFSCFLGH